MAGAVGPAPAFAGPTDRGEVQELTRDAGPMNPIEPLEVDMSGPYRPTMHPS
jgi:hypothetical protein